MTECYNLRYNDEELKEDLELIANGQSQLDSMVQKLNNLLLIEESTKRTI